MGKDSILLMTATSSRKWQWNLQRTPKAADCVVLIAIMLYIRSVAKNPVVELVEHMVSVVFYSDATAKLLISFYDSVNMWCPI